MFRSLAGVVTANVVSSDPKTPCLVEGRVCHVRVAVI
jgi:hypothetical protein